MSCVCRETKNARLAVEYAIDGLGCANLAGSMVVYTWDCFPAILDLLKMGTAPPTCKQGLILRQGHCFVPLQARRDKDQGGTVFVIIAVQLISCPAYLQTGPHTAGCGRYPSPGGEPPAAE